MAFPREFLDVILEGLAQLLHTTLQILGVSRLQICALEVAGEDLLEILPAINHVSRQVVEPGHGCVCYVNGEELDDEEVIIRLNYPACKPIVSQANTRIHLTDILDDVIQCSEALREACVMQIAPEHLGPRPLRAEFAPLSVIATIAMWITWELLRACALVPLIGLVARRGLRVRAQMVWLKTGLNLGRRGCAPQHWELCGSLLFTGLRAALARDRDLGPPLERALYLFRMSDTRGVPQLGVYLVHHVGRGCGQGYQERCHRSHILTILGEGRAWWTLVVDGGGRSPGQSPCFGVVDHYEPLHLERRLVML
jgi:hypothetical protein